MASKNTTKYKSNKQEKQVAKDIHGRVVPASGSIWSHKADTRNDTTLCECKTTEKTYYNLTRLTWDKIEKEALKDGMRLPVMCIELENKYKMAVVKEYDYCDFTLYKEYTNELVNLGEYGNRISIRIHSSGFFQLNGKKLLCINWHDFLDIINSEESYLKVGGLS